MSQRDLFDVGRPSTIRGEGAAEISACGRYRWTLERSWDDMGEGVANFIMLNPSKATATEPDPTLKRCIGFARSWGYAKLVITNLFAWRSTDPEQLKGRDRDEVIGPDNDDHILAWASKADIVVLAWGNHGLLYGRAAEVLAMLARIRARPHYLGLTSLGQPTHPLYLSAATRPTPLDPGGPDR